MNSFVALQKISQGRETELTLDEENTVARLLLPVTEEMVLDPMSFAQTILLQESQKHQKHKQKYVNVDFICPGSVMVESLFSVVGHMFNDRRCATTPVHVEEQVFLRMNNSVWNVNSLTLIDKVDDLLRDQQ